MAGMYLIDAPSGHCTPISVKKAFTSVGADSEPPPPSEMKSLRSPPVLAADSRIDWMRSMTVGSTSYMRCTIWDSGALNGSTITTFPSTRNLRLATSVTMRSASSSEISRARNVINWVPARRRRGPIRARRTPRIPRRLRRRRLHGPGSG